jgi:hypothetical protein
MRHDETMHEVPCRIFRAFGACLDRGIAEAPGRLLSSGAGVQIRQRTVSFPTNCFFENVEWRLV